MSNIIQKAVPSLRTLFNPRCLRASFSRCHLVGWHSLLGLLPPGRHFLYSTVRRPPDHAPFCVVHKGIPLKQPSTRFSSVVCDPPRAAQHSKMVVQSSGMYIRTQMSSDLQYWGASCSKGLAYTTRRVIHEGLGRRRDLNGVDTRTSIWSSELNQASPIW